MTDVNLQAGAFNLLVEQNDDVNITATFSISLTGYTTWTAKLKTEKGVIVPLTVDTTSQASSIIKVAVTGATTATFTEALWSLRALDPNGKAVTLLKGRIFTYPNVV